MVDVARLQEILVQYKAQFLPEWWKEERYKWEAVKCFHDNWNVKADDFADMLARSLAKTSNLMASWNNYPAAMMQSFAKADPEEVRAMYIALFDEKQDVISRVQEFKAQSSTLLEKYGDGKGQHYQNENAISTYLWLYNPDKYYIYKYGIVKNVATELGYNYHFKKGAYTDNLRNFFGFYDEVCAELQKDGELVETLKTQLSGLDYPYSELHTLTIDVGFYISRVICAKAKSDAEAGQWWPTDYSPELSVEQWAVLLQDIDVFTENSLAIMKRMKDYGGQATCTQLSVKYGETANFYNAGSSALAKRVAEKMKCPVMSRDEGQLCWWPILYLGRDAKNRDEGTYTWKLREELSEALDQADLENVKLYVQPTQEENRNYWWLNAKPSLWSFADIAVGETQFFSLCNENGNKRRVYQNFLDAKAGDMVIGYESQPEMRIVALGRVCAEQDGEKICFEKTEGLANPIAYKTLKDCPELQKMEFFVNSTGTLFRLTKGEYNFIMDLIREENPIRVVEQIETYDKEKFLSEVYMSEERYDALVGVLRNKKNIILQGAPGVGKTFAAKRLAYSIMGEKDESRIEFVQFHQNYSYEDFVMGYKPSDEGFELKYGIFYRFCQKADNQPDKDFFFIIDEINRGNMSKIFGELLMLIERDYRGTKATLAYNGIPFSVPRNLYIIGMMNTADRSLAMIDYALRRRFSFFDMEPGFNTEGFRKYQEEMNSENFSELVSVVQELNREISRDKSLGKGFCIGHSYFCGQAECTDEWLQSIVEFDILPMLSEYWFDEPNTLHKWENALRGVFDD